MKLRWSERSVNDLIAIQRYISQDNPQTAKKWLAKLRQRAKSTTETPLLGRIVPEFNQADIREVFQGNYLPLKRVYPTELILPFKTKENDHFIGNNT